MNDCRAGGDGAWWFIWSCILFVGVMVILGISHGDTQARLKRIERILLSKEQ